jgi:elongation factor 1-gamma
MDTPFGPVYESGAIMRYVARLRPDTGLLGSSFYQQSQVDQWIDYSGFELEPSRAAWLYPLWKITQFNPKIYEAAKEEVHKSLRLIESHLSSRTYLVGNQITLADIVIVTAFADLVKLVLTEADAKKYGNFSRWFTTCVNQPQFAAVLGQVEWAHAETPGEGAAVVEKKEGENKGGDKPKSEKPKGGDKPKKEAGDSKDKPKKEAGKREEGKKDDAKPKKEGAKSEDKPKKEEKPKPKKEEKPKPKEEKEEAADPDEDDTPKEKPSKNALDALPKSPMILDVVKKSFFATKPFNPNFFTEFWPQFDAAGYSIYQCAYKYDKEFAVFFLAGNLLGGFLQRVDKLRKYGFGVMQLCGETEDRAPWKLVGCWIFRGQDVPAEMRDCDDSEHYDWTKLDSSNGGVRERVQQYFIADKIDAGLVLDRRYFK